jgi:uncharacterized protein (TIGR03086 family)
VAAREIGSVARVTQEDEFMATDNLERAVLSTRAVLSGVSDEQLKSPTPCANWTVSELINHIVGVPFFFGSAVAGNDVGEAPDFASGDFLSSFDEGTALCVEAFQADGVLDRELKLPIGTFSGTAVLGIATTDTFVHGWDLARATGQPADLDPELAGQLLEAARQAIPDAYRNEEGNPFGLEKVAPPGASAADRLAAFLGRNV